MIYLILHAVKAAREINPELATVSLPDSYVLATKRMTCGSSIRPRLFRWPSRRPQSRSWLQEEPFSVPTWQRLTVAVGVHGSKCWGACRTSWETSSGFPTGEAAPRDLVCSCPGFPQCELVHGSCFCKTNLMLLFNSNKESRVLAFVAASTTHAKISCLLV